MKGKDIHSLSRLTTLKGTYSDCNYLYRMSFVQQNVNVLPLAKQNHCITTNTIALLQCYFSSTLLHTSHLEIVVDCLVPNQVNEISILETYKVKTVYLRT